MCWGTQLQTAVPVLETLLLARYATALGAVVHGRADLLKLLEPCWHHSFCVRVQANCPWILMCRYDTKLENVLRYRRSTGRHMPFMNVIPPGLDFSSLKVSKGIRLIKFVVNRRHGHATSPGQNLNVLPCGHQASCFDQQQVILWRISSAGTIVRHRQQLAS